MWEKNRVDGLLGINGHSFFHIIQDDASVL